MTVSQFTVYECECGFSLVDRVGAERLACPECDRWVTAVPVVPISFLESEGAVEAVARGLYESWNDTDFGYDAAADLDEWHKQARDALSALKARCPDG